MKWGWIVSKHVYGGPQVCRQLLSAGLQLIYVCKRTQTSQWVHTFHSPFALLLMKTTYTEPFPPHANTHRVRHGLFLLSTQAVVYWCLLILAGQKSRSLVTLVHACVCVSVKITSELLPNSLLIVWVSCVNLNSKCVMYSKLKWTCVMNLMP